MILPENSYLYWKDFGESCKLKHVHEHYASYMYMYITLTTSRLVDWAAVAIWNANEHSVGTEGNIMYMN